jgi:hypothetical protein
MARKVTNKLLEMMEEGALDPAYIARLALGYMSEDEVWDMAESNELIEEEVLDELGRLHDGEVMFGEDDEDDDDDEEEDDDDDDEASDGVEVETEELDFE